MSSSGWVRTRPRQQQAKRRRFLDSPEARPSPARTVRHRSAAPSPPPRHLPPAEHTAQHNNNHSDVGSDSSMRTLWLHPFIARV